MSLLAFGFEVSLFAENAEREQEYRASIVPLEQGVESPVALQQSMPAYTVEARVSSVEGILQLQAMVRKNGALEDLKVLKGLGYGLDESAIHTVATKWLFRPGIRNGAPVDVLVNIEVPFRLDSVTEAEREKRKDYPLRIFVAGTRWVQKPFSRMSGSGYINILDGELFRGFEYTTSCKALARPFNGDRAALGKWKEPEAHLEILIPKVGDAKKLDECELKVALVNYVYLPKNGGGLTSLTMEQWKEFRDTTRALERAMHPTDINTSHYPVRAELLEMNWTPFETFGISPGGFSAIGRGNIFSRDRRTGFDFTAVCPGPLQTSMPGDFYLGRWQIDGARLLVLSTRIGDSRNVQVCELKTSMRSGGIYEKNRSTGSVTLRTPDEGNRPVQTPVDLPRAPDSPTQNTPSSEQPLSPKLTNSDVIAMIDSGLSLDVVIAKIKASPCSFDTSPDGLKGLKDARVPDQVVIEMVKRLLNP
jgi:hypothetical protein